VPVATKTTSPSQKEKLTAVITRIMLLLSYRGHAALYAVIVTIERDSLRSAGYRAGADAPMYGCDVVTRGADGIY
jgi:hypothetical protein